MRPRKSQRAARRVAAAACAVVACLAVAIPALAATPSKVIATRATEMFPAATATHIAWTRNSRNAPAHFDAFVRIREAPESTTRVNPRGTMALTGGIDENNKLIYQQIRRGRSDLKIFDVVTKTRTDAPRRVNTRRWEWQPTMTENHILFGRGDPRSKRLRSVLLYNRNTRRIHRLASTATGLYSVVPGQVNGKYAVWWACTLRTCNVFRYNTRTGRTIKVPNPGKLQYAPSVTSDGVVYFARSGYGCGNHTSIRRYKPGSSTRITRLPLGIDVYSTYVTESGTLLTQNTEIFFARVNCKRGATDIYKLSP